MSKKVFQKVLPFTNIKANVLCIARKPTQMEIGFGNKKKIKKLF